MNIYTKNAAKVVIREMMNKVIEKRTITEPFDENGILNSNPFGARLVPIEIWKASKFERSFVTSMGQKTFEQLGKVIAEGSGAFATNQHVENLVINTYRKERIEDILTAHRRSQRDPNWDLEIEDILSLTNPRRVDVRVRSDLYIRRQDGSEEFYSIKTVKPNLDQTQHAKNDMLTIKAGKPDAEVYFGLPFNPAGEGQSYRTAHSIPFKIFRMEEDDCVLIGGAFWNKIGADPNTYNELIEIFEEIGGEYRDTIRVDYLGLE